MDTTCSRRHTPHGWDRIFFYLFDEQTVQTFWEEWRGLEVKAKQPATLTVSSGIVPSLSRDQTKKNRAVAGVYYQDGRPVESSWRIRSKGGRAKQFAEQLPVVVKSERPAFYLGVNNMQFGHFLLETLARAWAWQDLGAGRVPVLQLPPLKGFGRSLFELVPGLLEKLQIVTQPTQFDDILVPGPALGLKQFIHVEMKNLFEGMAARSGTTVRQWTDQPVYLSRSALGPNAKRVLLAERRLEAFLEDQGFRIVHPEKLSIVEQIGIFNTHRWIVSLQGSACHSRLFSCGMTNLLVLTDELNPNYVLCDLVTAGTAHYANVLAKKDYFAIAGIDKQVLGQPLVMNVRLCLEVLRRLCLIQSNASLEIPPLREADYLNLWLYNARKQAARSRDGEMLEQLQHIEKQGCASSFLP